MNVVGSIPDYRLMIDYIIDILTGAGDNDAFVFRTTKATTRFRKAVADGFLDFHSESHKDIFINSLKSGEISTEEKLLVLFWQFIFCNRLFREITENVFLRLLYSGRTVIETQDVEAYLRHLKKEYPEEIGFSDTTLRIIASKYLTVIRKFGLAEGRGRKELRPPHISSRMFVSLVYLALGACPEDKGLDNPMFRYSFLDRQSMIARLKSIDNIRFWDITQIGNDITINLKRHEREI